MREHVATMGQCDIVAIYIYIYIQDVSGASAAHLVSVLVFVRIHLLQGLSLFPCRPLMVAALRIKSWSLFFYTDLNGHLSGSKYNLIHPKGFCRKLFWLKVELYLAKRSLRDAFTSFSPPQKRAGCFFRLKIQFVFAQKVPPGCFSRYAIRSLSLRKIVRT